MVPLLFFFKELFRYHDPHHRYGAFYGHASSGQWRAPLRLSERRCHTHQSELGLPSGSRKHDGTVMDVEKGSWLSWHLTKTDKTVWQKICLMEKIRWGRFPIWLIFFNHQPETVSRTGVVLFSLKTGFIWWFITHPKLANRVAGWCRFHHSNPNLRSHGI